MGRVAADPSPPGDRGLWQRLRFDNRVFLLALLVGVPGLSVSLLFFWLGDFSSNARWTATVLLVGAWLVLALVLREHVVRPIQTLANVLAAFREGDFSIRARVSGSDDPLALAYHEVNALEHILREQRLGAVEAGLLLQRVLEEIDVAVFAFDQDRKVRLLNHAAARLIGRSEDQAIGASAADLRLAETLDGPAPRTIELSHPGGSGRWEFRRTVIRQEGERLELVVLSDLSRALREEERQAWKRLVRVLGHEINNSLAPIKSISTSLRELLDREPRPPDWDADLAHGLDVVGSRAESLSRFMAAYARLARLPAPELAPMKVEEWVRHVATLETRLEVAVAAGTPVEIHADRAQLDQALINLVRNAVDAVIEVRGGDPQGAATGSRGVSITWSADERQVVVLVEDEGPGVEETGNLFVPFFTTKPGGSGIGLVLSRQIVEAHGGTLVLENRDEGEPSESPHRSSGARGARARIVLPR